MARATRVLAVFGARYARFGLSLGRATRALAVFGARYARVLAVRARYARVLAVWALRASLEGASLKKCDDHTWWLISTLLSKGKMRGYTPYTVQRQPASRLISGMVASGRTSVDGSADNGGSDLSFKPVQTQLKPRSVGGR